VFLGARRISGDLKVTFRVSGRWRFGFSDHEAARPDSLVPPGKDRALWKWDRPAEVTPGMTLALRVFVPTSEITMPASGERSRDVTWWPSRAPAQWTVFTKSFRVPAPR
jgi:hypothetical protein